MRCRKRIALVLLAVLLGGAIGCTKVTRENYDKIQSGMSLSEVEGILGKGTEKAGMGGAIGNLSGSARIVVWGGEEKSITITFANDKVVAKAASGL